MKFTKEDLTWLEQSHALKSKLGFYEIKFNDDYSLFVNKDFDNNYCIDLLHKYNVIKTIWGKTLKEAFNNIIAGCLLEIEVLTKFLQNITTLSDVKK